MTFTVDSSRVAMFRQRIAAQDIRLPGYADIWALWQSHLLDIGGVDVVPGLEPDPLLGDLLESSEVFPGNGALLVAGDPNSCHDNVATLALSGAGVAGWTGYALSEDGLWRQHSWAIDDQQRVVETTVGRLTYCGILIPAHLLARWTSH